MKRWYFYPFSLIYDLITTCRNWLYDKGLFKSTKFQTPIIGVGNLSVGGSGKSPMVMYLMGLLLDDYEAGVLSRGYGRKTQGYYMVNYDSNFRMVGDEAMQLFQRFKNRIAIGVCENRVVGAERLIEEAGLQVLVLDDSYQHRAIQAGFNILLTDYSDPYFSDYLLPAGNLRESRTGANRADIIMVTKCPKDLTEEKKFYFISKIKPKKHQKVFFSSIDYDEEITSSKVKMPVKMLDQYEVLLITGIANPSQLIKEVSRYTDKIKHLRFRDHYSFKKEDIDKMLQEYKKLGEKKPMNLSFYTKDEVQKHSTLDSLSFYTRLLNTGFVSVNPQTGAIKTYVGGVDFEHFKYDHVLQSKRQVGSIFKPIVYATALEVGMPICTHFSPRALTYADEKFWTPRNASKTDDDPYTYYSVGKALKESLNTIAVQTLFYAGLNNVLSKARAMGIRSTMPKVPSIALGSAELSVIEMAKAYTTFANNGVPSQPYFIEKITDKKGKIIWQHKPKKEAAAISQTTAQQMIQLMRATVNEGTAARMRGQYGLTNDLAGKTGTTQDNKDGWFAGLLPNLVMIAWVGNDLQIGFRSTYLGQGANSALPIAALFVSQLNRNKQFNAITRATFSVPDEIREEIINCEPVVREGFLDRLLSDSGAAKDTIRAGEVHYRIYERKGKLHDIDNGDEEISIDDVVNPSAAAKNTASSTQQQDDKPKKKGFFGRIFK